MILLQCHYPNVRRTFFAGKSSGNGCGHISMIFNRRDMSENVILTSCDTLMDILKGSYQFLAGLHC